MKKIARVMTAWVLAVVLAFSCTIVFAEGAAAAAEEEYSYSDILKHIAKNIAFFGRYENLTENGLYLKALQSLIEENPELYEKAVRVMVESVDENSAYYNEEETAAFLDDLGDEVVGIGVSVLSQNGRIVVSQPVPGSPAEKAGIRAGDIIVAADGIELKDMVLDEAIEYIRGTEGTSVRITVMRSGMEAPMNFNIIREKVTSASLDLEILEENDKRIAKITVYSFTEHVAAQFEEALNKMDAQGVKNLIIDLRDNGGGYLDQAIEMADMLLPDGKLITTEDHKVDLLDKQYKSTGVGRDYEIVVLINEMSASSSEVLTAALMENDAATVIGTKSFGKGTVQAVYDVPNNAMMKFTVAYYLTPLGNNIHEKGIIPHDLVENSAEPVDMSQFEIFKYQKSYRLGDKGEEIQNAKEMLELLGLFYGEINDIYDENLKIAVNTYQEAKGLYPYGVLDLTTQMSLYDTVSASKIEVDDQLQAAIDAF